MVLYKVDIISKSTRKIISDNIMIHFPEENSKELTIAMNLIGYANHDSFIDKVFSFFEECFIDEIITIGNLDKIDFKNLGYKLIAYTNLANPQFSSESERIFVRNILFKTSRIFIHEILFPHLESIGFEFKDKITEKIISTVSRVSKIEKYNRSQILLDLGFEQVEIRPSIGFSIKGRESTIMETEIKRKHYLVFNLNEAKLNSLISLIQYSPYSITDSSKAHLKDYFKSEGKSIEPIFINPKKLETFIHLIFLLKSEKVDKNNYAIDMSKGNAIWEYVQENTFNSETKNIFKCDVRDLSSRINKNNKGKYSNAILEAKEILKQTLNLKTK